MYRLQLKPSAQKDLDRLRGSLWERVKTAIVLLATDPRPHRCSKLRGDAGYKIRAGDYRILYDIEDESRIVTILRVTHRRDAYK